MSATPIDSGLHVRRSVCLCSTPKPKTRATVSCSCYGRPVALVISAASAPSHLCGDGLKEVGPARAAVADVVTDKIRDDRRVARVVLGDRLLYLAARAKVRTRDFHVYRVGDESCCCSRCAQDWKKEKDGRPACPSPSLILQELRVAARRNT